MKLLNLILFSFLTYLFSKVFQALLYYLFFLTGTYTFYGIPYIANLLLLIFSGWLIFIFFPKKAYLNGLIVSFLILIFGEAISLISPHYRLDPIPTLIGFCIVTFCIFCRIFLHNFVYRRKSK